MTDLEELKARLDAMHARAVDHLFVTYLGCWKREDPLTAAETTAVSGTLVAALITVAARVGQDMGMSADDLANQAREAHAQAIINAPKWG